MKIEINIEELIQLNRKFKIEEKKETPVGATTDVNTIVKIGNEIIKN